MEFAEQDIQALKEIAPSLSVANEGGYSYILINKIKLPSNCKPLEIDALLCPMQKDGYQSRLYFAEKLSGCNIALNWNANVRILGRTWYGISWQTPEGLSLKEMLLVHLKAFTS
jgi:hypothetical protein